MMAPITGAAIFRGIRVMIVLSSAGIDSVLIMKPRRNRTKPT